MSTNYISATDTAKLVRKALKENFPNVKFSVKTSKYSGGSSIDVSWIDGPTSDEAKEVAAHFHGASFDGMTDMKEYNGQPYANDYIFFNHEHSAQAIQEAAKKFSDKYGSDIEIPEIKVSTYDGTGYMDGDGGTVGGGGWNMYWNARSVIYRILENKDN